MSNPLNTLATRLARMARAFRDPNTRRDIATPEWVTIDVSGPTPLLEMYRDLLKQHGIPSVVTDAGVGPGALGGVPGFGLLRVHAADAARARALVCDDAGDDDGTNSERTLTRGE